MTDCGWFCGPPVSETQFEVSVKTSKLCLSRGRFGRVGTQTYQEFICANRIYNSSPCKGHLRETCSHVSWSIHWNGDTLPPMKVYAAQPPPPWYWSAYLSGKKPFSTLAQRKVCETLRNEQWPAVQMETLRRHENFDVKGNMACPININKQYHEKKYELLIPKRQEYHSRKSKGSVTWGCRPGKNGYNYQMVGKL